MSASPEAVTLLDRLLRYLGHDAGNLVLRRDAVRVAFDSGQWETARELIDAGLWLHAEDPELLALSGFAHLQAQSFDAAQTASRATSGRGDRRLPRPSRIFTR